MGHWVRFRLPSGKYKEFKVGGKAFDPYTEKVCPRCGRKDIVMVNSGVLHICPRCLAKWVDADGMLKRGEILYKGIVTDKRIVCDECGRYSRVLFGVRPRYLCLRCAWYVFGKKRYRLKANDVRIV